MYIPGFLRTASNPSSLPNCSTPYFPGASGIPFIFSAASRTFSSGIKLGPMRHFAHPFLTRRVYEKYSLSTTVFRTAGAQKNTISCSVAAHGKQGIVLLSESPLNRKFYDFEGEIASYDFI